MSAALELRTTSPVFAYLQRRDATSPARGAFLWGSRCCGTARRVREINMSVFAANPRTLSYVNRGRNLDSDTERRNRRVALQ
jgi:hypothetical protein